MSARCLACGHQPGDPLPVGRILRFVREARRMTGEAVLDRAGLAVDSARYYAIERVGRRRPDSDVWEPLCRALGIDPGIAATGDLERVLATADPPLPGGGS